MRGKRRVKGLGFGGGSVKGGWKGGSVNVPQNSLLAAVWSTGIVSLLSITVVQKRISYQEQL